MRAKSLPRIQSPESRVPISGGGNISGVFWQAGRHFKSVIGRQAILGKLDRWQAVLAKLEVVAGRHFKS